MVVIPEQHLTRRIPDPAAETEIIKLLVEGNYRVIDQNQIRTIRYNDEMRQAARGDATAALAVARQFGAEIMIVGEAFSQAAEAGHAGMVTCRARVEARMFRTDTGEILAADGKHASGIDGTEELAAKKALAAAGNQVAKYFMDQMDRRAREAKKTGAPKIIELVISDIPYAKFAELKTAMKGGIAGITKYNQRNYEANRAELEVEFTEGDAQTLADALAAARFQSLRLTIVKATPNRIDMSVAPR